jgi:coenzyme Q-binding protein COQ10
MAEYREQRVLPYTPAQLFDLVVDIEQYPKFLPWCVGARIRKRDEAEITADLAIGFKVYREKFTSHVTIQRPDRIDVRYADGPFKYLKNRWIFEPDPGGCRIDFYVDFEFRSRILQTLIEALFTEAVHRMVAAFEGRAKALYGAPAFPMIPAEKAARR